tara:strand:+ start:9366 stop:9734 length:369 start_codon:yes stop_codon:yes gene_type:complete
MEDIAIGAISGAASQLAVELLYDSFVTVSDTEKKQSIAYERGISWDIVNPMEFSEDYLKKHENIIRNRRIQKGVLSGLIVGIVAASLRHVYNETMAGPSKNHKKKNKKKSEYHKKNDYAVKK